MPFCFCKELEAVFSTFKSSYESDIFGEINTFLYCSKFVPIPVEMILFLNPESGLSLEEFSI